MFPPLRRGGTLEIAPQSAGGATTITPQNGRSGISAPHDIRPTMRSRSSGMWIRRCEAKSSGRALLYVVGYATQISLVNRVIAAPVLITLTLTFGLDLVLNNMMLVAFTADYRKINLVNPLQSIEI